ncbi:MAG: RDD family protein [Thalassotalea sp.]|nr:RDD family protein [Thalassotalea sp.]
MNNVVYANSIQRLFANAIDGLLILIPMLIISSLAFIDISIAIVAMLFSHLAYWSYSYYFHSRFGATLGKHIMGIQILSVELRRIDNKVAFKRGMVDLVFAITGAFFALTAIYQVEFNHFSSLTFFAREEYLASLAPEQALVCAQLFSFWLMSEFIVMLFNKRKQATQDWFAGTVIVVKASLNDSKQNKLIIEQC